LARNPNEIVGRTKYPGFLWLWVFWTAIGSLSYVRHSLQDYGAALPGKILFEFLAWLTCFYPWIALAPVVFRFERRYPLGTRGWAKNLALLIAAAMPFAYLAAMITQVMGAILRFLFQVSGHLSWHVPASEIGVQLALYWTTVAGAYIVRNRIQLHEREQQAAKLALEKSHLESTLRQAELETLRARLNPHFLFNCLQNISVLTREDPQRASQMVTSLGVLLRCALRRDGTPETTLADEIELTKTYIAVEQIRFADRLSVLLNIAAETESALIPSLLLQPLVENAIVHGLRGIDGAGVISIRSAIESENLLITVTDNGIGLPVKDPSAMELGIGLASTCERLEKMYPHQHSFFINSLPEGGTQVQVSIPLRFAYPPVGVSANEQTAAVGR